MKRAALALLIVAVSAGFGSGERVFAPSSDLWERWTAHDPGSNRKVDHGAWDAFLKTYLRDGEDGVTRVAYGAVTEADRSALDGYIDRLSTTDVAALSRPVQMAYWINLYNALTVRTVLDHYPVESIQDIDISPGLFSSGPWGAALVSIDGEDLSLNDIEHRILRPIWDDPRIHYAVNCASIGCPDLAPAAYTGERLEAMLESAARAYVNDPRGVAIRDGTVTVSRIYDWFIEDFGNSERGVLAHLIAYSDPDQAQRLKDIGALSGTAYDWSLNGAE